MQQRRCPAKGQPPNWNQRRVPASPTCGPLRPSTFSTSTSRDRSGTSVIFKARCRATTARSEERPIQNLHWLLLPVFVGPLGGDASNRRVNQRQTRRGDLGKASPDRDSGRSQRPLTASASNRDRRGGGSDRLLANTNGRDGHKIDFERMARVVRGLEKVVTALANSSY